ncbi:hypothetical protein HG537_0F02330 [Torulaspora globosa]|uniref:Replication factor C subunit 1 n=1 Tax=Torulaspora globosa TaxID=48254 RepID=A0A7H9HYD5_9SACH|nr:hypothetical protein HG537_0F02330 [Torulaspora sp. CBS 2947]
MVNIDDFFQRGKQAGKSLKRADVKKNVEPEVIQLDDEDDLPLKKRRRTSIGHDEVKKTEIKAVPAKRSTQGKKSNLAAVGAAHDVLETIPSVDLSSVHVKENVKFDFSRSGQSARSDIHEGSPVDFPEGRDNCLLGLTMVFTGVLPNLERGQAEALAKRYGARVTKSISSKTSVVVLGDEAGPKKLENIRKLGIKAIDEEGFKQLIASMPAGGGDAAAAQKARQKLQEQEEQAVREAEEMIKREKERAEKISADRQAGVHARDADRVNEEHQLWTVKYAPANLQQICGNKSSVAKLKNWLTNWEENRKNGFKIAGRDGTGTFRAAMLYGPPGIGKTTAAHLVAKEVGYDILEQNASDVRSKSLLNAGVKNSLDNMSVYGYFHNRAKIDDLHGKRFVIIMDEVDGMSGGDRGGVGQLANFCRKTSTPMILICNERNLPKMRPFDRVCLDIQFRRPDANSIKARLMTIAVREKFKLDPNVIDRLVQATRGDIRQIINLLSTVSTTSKEIGHSNISDISAAWEKNIALKPFDIAHKMLDGRLYTEAGSKHFNLNDKIALYFDDFDFAPLMIQENYLNTRPSNLKPNTSHLMAVAEAADSISQSNLVEKRIRSSEQLWSLLPLHAVLSSVYPASLVAGQMAGRINFTAWLGQNSKTGKYSRLLQELQYHTKLSTSANGSSLRLDYIPTLKRRLLNPIVKDGSEGISSVITVMDKYYLTKEDWDNIMDFLVGPDATAAILKKIPTAVKTAFTRKYNSTTHPVAIYRTGTTTAATAAVSAATPDFEDVVDADETATPVEEDETQDDNDFKKDKLIKQKAKPTRKRTRTPSTKEATTKKRRTKA